MRGPHYRTRERPTGETWHNGKEIYSKVVSDLGSGTYSVGTTLIPHGLDMSEVDSIVEFSGFVKRDVNEHRYPVNFVSPQWPTYAIGSDLSATDIELLVGEGWADSPTSRLSDGEFLIKFTLK